MPGSFSIALASAPSVKGPVATMQGASGISVTAS